MYHTDWRSGQRAGALSELFTPEYVTGLRQTTRQKLTGRRGRLYIQYYRNGVVENGVNLDLI